jgi:hypothetical protein
MPGHLARLRLPASSILPAATAVVLTVLAAGCGSDNNPTKPAAATTSAFTGWFGNGSESGMLSVTIHRANLAGRLQANRAAAVAATAGGFLYHSGGTTDTLSGTYDDVNGYVDLTGGGYTLSGLYDSDPPSEVFGTYTGPNGNGQFLSKTGATSSADVYCGTYQNDAHTSHGTFTFAIRGTTVEGVAIESGSSSAPGFTGTMSGTGTTRTIDIATTITNGYKTTAAGTLNTGTHLVGGLYHITFNAAPYDSGDWSGERCGPPVMSGY